MNDASIRGPRERSGIGLRSGAPRGSLAALLVAALAAACWWAARPPAGIPAIETAAWIDPRTAPVESLRLLPGIGPKLAARIEQARRDGADFAEAEDLLRVPGIGPSRVERLRPLLRTGGASLDPHRAGLADGRLRQGEDR